MAHAKGHCRLVHSQTLKLGLKEFEKKPLRTFSDGISPTWSDLFSGHGFLGRVRPKPCPRIRNLVGEKVTVKKDLSMWNLLSLDPKSSYSSASRQEILFFFGMPGNYDPCPVLLFCSRVKTLSWSQKLVLLAGAVISTNKNEKYQSLLGVPSPIYLYTVYISIQYTVHEYQQMWTTPLTSSILISHQNYFRNETRPSSYSKRSQVSHEKNLLLSIESWLFNRDPFKALLRSPYNWVLLIPNKSPKNNNQVFFSLLESKSWTVGKAAFHPDRICDEKA